MITRTEDSHKCFRSEWFPSSAHKKYFVDEVCQNIVTVGSTGVLSLPDCQTIGNIFAELGNQRAELEQFVEHLLNQIQELGNDVVVKSQELESQQDLLNTRLEDQPSPEAGTDDQELHLRQVLHELDDIKKELAEERAKHHARSEKTHLGAEDLIRQLNVAREDLSVARSQLQQQRLQLENFESLKGNEHAQRMEQLVQERAALEGELELVRRRASEMNNTLNEHKQQALLQKEEWTSELNQLREVVENQSQMTPEPSQKEARETPEAPRSPSEHVVGSVMAQFAKVQKDVVRRRAKAKKEG